jgi:cytochrome c5
MKARIPIAFLGILVIGCAASGGGAPPPATQKGRAKVAPKKAVTQAVAQMPKVQNPRKKPVVKVTKVKPPQDKTPPNKGKEKTPKKAQGPFEGNAFPPTLSDLSYHRTGWKKNDCLRCHETGVGKAPSVQHKGMPKRLLTAKCRSCHVLIPGSKAKVIKKDSKGFLDNAFPPMIPASPSHKRVWGNNNCLLCHDSGIRGAPIVKHKGMPRILLKSKCRSCHVQVRVLDAKKGGH